MVEYDSSMRKTRNDMFAADEPKQKLAVGEYSAPSNIRLDGDRLFWHPVEHWRKVKPTTQTFSDFLPLGSDEASGKDVLFYARKWGVLNLCRKDLLPVSHDHACIPLERRSDGKGEPISEWRRFAQLAAAILNLSQDLTDGRIGKNADWVILSSYDRLLPWSSNALTLAELGLFGSRPTRKHTATAYKEAVLEGKAVIADSVNHWLELGNVRPHMRWNEVEPVVSLAGGAHRGGLFGVLAVHLLELAGRYVIASCSGCRKFYNPEIRPKSGQDRFCKQCRQQGVPIQLASHRRNLRVAEHRAKKRAKTARER
jgi:hypothetical protein